MSEIRHGQGELEDWASCPSTQSILGRSLLKTSGEERTVDRRGRQFGPRMALVPSLPRAFPWGSPRAQDPHQETRLGRKGGGGASQYWQGLGTGAKMRGQFLALFLNCWGLELVFDTVYLCLPGGGRRKRRRS